MKIYYILFLFFFGLPFLFPEVILLNDKEVIKGTIKEISDDKVIMNTNYGEITLKKTDIKKIYLNENEYNLENSAEDTKNENESQNETKSLSKLNDKKTQKEILENNLEYFTEKKLISLGVGFMVSGFSINMATLMIFLPINLTIYNLTTLDFLICLSASGLFLQSIGIVSLVNGCIAYANYLKNKDNVYEKDESTSLYQTFLSIATGFLIPGAILTSIGIGVGIPIFVMPLYLPEAISLGYPGYQIGLGYLITFFSIGALFDIISVVFYSLANSKLKKWKSANAISFDFGFKNNGISAELALKF